MRNSKKRKTPWKAHTQCVHLWWQLPGPKLDNAALLCILMLAALLIFFCVHAAVGSERHHNKQRLEEVFTHIYHWWLPLVCQLFLAAHNVFVDIFDSICVQQADPSLPTGKSARHTRLVSIFGLWRTKGPAKSLD